MADLICIRDAYKAMNKSLLGEETALVFNEGGSRKSWVKIFQVVEKRNVSDKWKQDDNSPIKILDTVSLTPEEGENSVKMRRGCCG